MANHYLTKEHQLAIIKLICHLSNNSPNVQYGNQFVTDATQLQGANKVISIFTGGIQALNDEVKQFGANSVRMQNSVDILTCNYALMECNTYQQNVNLSEWERRGQALQRDIALLQQEIEDRSLLSSDGTLVWKIPNVGKKLSKIFLLISDTYSFQ
jgi:hypothetical protein